MQSHVGDNLAHARTPKEGTTTSKQNAREAPGTSARSLPVPRDVTRAGVPFLGAALAARSAGSQPDLR